MTNLFPVMGKRKTLITGYEVLRQGFSLGKSSKGSVKFKVSLHHKTNEAKPKSSFPKPEKALRMAQKALQSGQIYFNNLMQSAITKLNLSDANTSSRIGEKHSNRVKKHRYRM